jgi:hypothetical protein
MAAWLHLLTTLACMLGAAGYGSESTQMAAAQEGGDSNSIPTGKVPPSRNPGRPLELGLLAPRLDATPDDSAADGRKILMKSGHWTSTIQSMRSQNDNFVGYVTIEPLDQGGHPLAYAETPYTLRFTRPVVLAKAIEKQIEAELLISGTQQSTFIRSSLMPQGSLAPAVQINSPHWIHMPSYQYDLLVLAKEPDRYEFLKMSLAVRTPWEDDDGLPTRPHYHVVLANASGRFPLSSGLLTWTSLAAIFWDEVDPARLTHHEQQALVDWLHWGGRLIISGPDSLDLLKGSFLEPYLPAEANGRYQVAAASLKWINQSWTRRTEGKPIRPVIPKAPWSAVRLRPRAETMPSRKVRPQINPMAGFGGLLFNQRGVGRGSILVTGIQLAERDWISWPGHDSFLNGVLLQRPRRRFSAGSLGGLRTEWADYPDHRLNARFTTGLRFFSRDTADPFALPRKRMPKESQVSAPGATSASPVSSIPEDRPGGLGAWDPFSSVSNAARQVLKDAAAVRVPTASFVMVCLLVYLILLVPLNWMVFRALGRIEWAWFAVPVLAIFAAILVIWQAQLDIGFVRSQTEIGVFELAGDYPRGHLSRYTALYTSLSSTYNVRLDDPRAQVTPFPVDQINDPTPKRPINPITLRKDQNTWLQGLTINSATTKMFHAEQMVTLEGPIRWSSSSQGHRQVENHTGYDLKEGILLRRRADQDGMAQWHGCWLGELRSGQSAVVGNLESIAAGLIPFADQRAHAALIDSKERIDLEPLLGIAMHFESANTSPQDRREEVRLLARINARLPGIQVSPPASQVQGATLVVAHLHLGPLPDPQPDVNSPGDLDD